MQCYDLLIKLYPSPVIELNRAVVISELNGPSDGIKAIDAIEQISTLKKYYLLPATLGELHLQLKQYETADKYFAEAILLTQSAVEKKLLQLKMKRSEAN